ncbi:PhaM family polyhydroxyalkanoate granule multifunctional regulatory protein [Undibacterium fentianense]|uniref:Tfp pilus assembly protein FimV n=1 Tax=Undibacterium fentianense TaxID=2828728 RepID=A0A941E8S4_9BURK|nr:PhaM family polyhydroxyalkanoate granule multifunctional regulatory protein [Undibacterium fentianense]MBR7800723.1 hypothetical protein [Undibacterium fentianense]
MQNPFQQAGSHVNDPLGFVKKIWGDMQLPGMVTPTLSVDELDKQIQDLKTVESWLTVNMNMLKGTIQALEVQRATIAALKAMGESFAQTSSRAESANGSHFGTAGQSPSASPHATWPMHAQAAEPSVEENEEDEELDELDDVDAPIESLDAAKEEVDSATDKPVKTAQASTAEGFQSPAAWWTLLQDQFKQALSNALKDESDTDKADDITAGSDEKAPSKPRAKRSPMNAKGQSKSTVTAKSSTAKGVSKAVAKIPKAQQKIEPGKKPTGTTKPRAKPKSTKSVQGGVRQTRQSN